MKHSFYAVSADGSCAISTLVGELLANQAVIGIAPIKWSKEFAESPATIETDCDILVNFIRSAADTAGIALFIK